MDGEVSGRGSEWTGGWLSEKALVTSRCGRTA